MNAPTPHEKGWIISSNEISIRWVTRNQAPTELMKHLACKCKRTHCNTNQCSCHCSSVSCMELCCWVNCNNTSITSAKNELLNEVTDAEDEEDKSLNKTLFCNIFLLIVCLFQVFLVSIIFIFLHFIFYHI